MYSLASSQLRAWSGPLRSIASVFDLWMGTLWESLTEGAPAGHTDQFVAWTDRTVGLGFIRGPEPEMNERSALGQAGEFAAAVIIRLLESLRPAQLSPHRALAWDGSRHRQ